MDEQTEQIIHHAGKNAAFHAVIRFTTTLISIVFPHVGVSLTYLNITCLLEDSGLTITQDYSDGIKYQGQGQRAPAVVLTNLLRWLFTRNPNWCGLLNLLILISSPTRCLGTCLDSGAVKCFSAAAKSRNQKKHLKKEPLKKPFQCAAGWSSYKR